MNRPSRFPLLILALLLLTPPLHAQPQEASEFRLPAPERLVAIGDVHGNLTVLRKALRLAGAIDAEDKWVGGKLVVVVTGDFMDRGDSELEIIHLFQRLETEAAQAGGALHVLIGNHEVMNVQGKFPSVTKRGFRAFCRVPGINLDDPRVKKEKKKRRCRRAAFMPGGPMARWFARHPVALIVGDSLFVHGGLLPRHARMGIDRINHEFMAWMAGKSDEIPDSLSGKDGPLWRRDYSKDPGKKDCKQLKKALEITGTARMVVGHTVQKHINSSCDDRVWKIDTGMNPEYQGGPVQVLEIKGSMVRVLKEPRHRSDAPRPAPESAREPHPAAEMPAR